MRKVATSESESRVKGECGIAHSPRREVQRHGGVRWPGAGVGFTGFVDVDRLVDPLFLRGDRMVGDRLEALVPDVGRDDLDALYAQAECALPHFAAQVARLAEETGGVRPTHTLAAFRL